MNADSLPTAAVNFSEMFPNYSGEDALTGKIIYRGTILLKSPMLIGTGEKDGDVDMMVMRDHRGRPYIPGTSLMGALRSSFRENFADEYISEQSKYFWGSPKKSTSTGIKEKHFQSAFFIRDLPVKSKNPRVSVRDGIAIDNSTGIVIPEKKFEYEVVETGGKFDFYGELTLRSKYNVDDFKAMADMLLGMMKTGQVTVGARSTRGLGRICLTDCEISEMYFNGKNARTDVLNWLSRDYVFETYRYMHEDSHYKNANTAYNFAIKAAFDIKNSLLIRSYSADPGAPDTTPVTVNGEPVIPGTSMAGAIRNRAERILNTLTDTNVQGMMHKLFGWVDDRGENNIKYKSRVEVEEKKLKENSYQLSIQNRIKIDRFTGGTIKTALFDEEAVWPVAGENEMLDLSLRIKDCEPHEAGLIMLVLKDLWSGDLPVGGGKSIGRGVLKGVSAIIEYHDRHDKERNIHTLRIESSGENGESISIGEEENSSFFEQCVEKLVNKLRENTLREGE